MLHSRRILTTREPRAYRAKVETHPRRLLVAALVAAPFLTGPTPAVVAQWYETSLFGEMRCRGIGPPRGGRTKAVAGVPAQPNVLFIGVCNGGGLQRPDLSTGDGIYRSADGGKTWTHITSGIPDGAPVNVVREDPKRKGLLFAGTEREVFVSFNDGEHWQSLRLDMPASSMRDLIVKDDDLVVATHGRGSGFWTTLRRCGSSTRPWSRQQRSCSARRPRIACGGT